MNNTTTKAAETAKKAGTTRNTGVRTMVQIAMLAAVATVLMLWEVPMPFIAPSFYKMDLSEVPIMIGAFAMGPLAAAVIELIKILLNFVLNGTRPQVWENLVTLSWDAHWLCRQVLFINRQKQRNTQSSVW